MTCIEYRNALDLQRDLVYARQNQWIDNDVVLFLEHPSVFTLGRRGGLENLKVSTHFLKRKKIPIIQVERGGDITFHGPGQLVVYPIMDLKNTGLRVLDYLSSLEEIMFQVLSDWGLHAERNPINRGIWIANKKIGSVGISVKNGVCFHGFALNVNLSLKPFGWINPCGLQGVGVTSMAQELSQKISMDQVRKAARRYFKSIFGFKLIKKELAELHLFLKGCGTKHVSLESSNQL